MADEPVIFLSGVTKNGVTVTDHHAVGIKYCCGEKMLVNYSSKVVIP